MERSARPLHFLHLLTVLGPADILVGLSVEQDRLAREFCVRRAVPEMARACHGQCHLTQQLNA